MLLLPAHVMPFLAGVDNILGLLIIAIELYAAGKAAAGAPGLRSRVSAWLNLFNGHSPARRDRRAFVEYFILVAVFAAIAGAEVPGVPQRQRP